MVKFLVLSAILAVICGFSESAFSPGLRIRFGINLLKISEYFVDVPRELPAVVRAGWTPLGRLEDSPFLPELNLYCPAEGYSLCAFFDNTGYIAGLQIALPTDKFTGPVPSDLSKIGFKKWTPPAISGESQREYWINQQFFVSETTLKRSAAERQALRPNGEVLYDGGVWVPDFGAKTLKLISNVESKFLSDDPRWIKQACIPLMGQHHFYSTTTQADCAGDYQPFSWFTLSADEQLVGTGLIVMGKRETDANKRNWFESPGRLAVEGIVPNSNTCFYDYAETYGLVTMHIYYINHPLQLLCI